MKHLYLLFLLIPFFNFGQQQIGQTIDYSGRSISISENGQIVAVGNYINEVNGVSQVGSARVYKYINGNWTQVGQDLNGMGLNSAFGSVVSLSANGKTLATIEKVPNLNTTNTKITVYKEFAGNWNQNGQSIYTSALNFPPTNKPISLSADGNRLAIGESTDNANINYEGRVRIFENTTGSWIQLGTDIVGKAPADKSGTTVAMHPTKNIVAFVSNPYYTNTEYVSVYSLNASGNWVQLGTDFHIPEDPIQSQLNGYLGASISLASNGNDIILAIGCPRASNNSSIKSMGIAQVYKYNTNTNVWTQIGADITSPAYLGYFGNAVSLSSNGKRLAVRDNNAILITGKGNDGFVQVYENVSGNWNQIATTITSTAADERLETCDMDLSSDGNTIALGLKNLTNPTSFHVRVYDLTKAASLNEYVSNNFKIFPNPATNILNITLEDDLVLERADIYNNLGQIIKTSSTPILDISDISSGMYFVEVTTNHGKATKKLIIN